MRFIPEILHQQIESLKLAFPELLEDIDAWQSALESETDVNEGLRFIERNRRWEEGESEKLKTIISDYSKRLAAIENRERGWRYLEFTILQWAELKKIVLPEATLSIRQGTPKVVIVDEAAIPNEYMRVRKEPDKALIKAALADGFASVPGATMSNAEPVLSVRVK